jgi:hypothetical protein
VKSKKVKLVEAESRMEVTRDWGWEDWGDVKKNNALKIKYLCE